MCSVYNKNSSTSLPLFSVGALSGQWPAPTSVGPGMVRLRNFFGLSNRRDLGQKHAAGALVLAGHLVREQGTPHATGQRAPTEKKRQADARILITHTTHAIASRSDPPRPRALRPLTPTERLLETSGMAYQAHWRSETRSRHDQGKTRVVSQGEQLADEPIYAASSSDETHLSGHGTKPASLSSRDIPRERIPLTDSSCAQQRR